jgi:hypothetical protein
MGGVTNQELVHKATVTTENLASAGKLNPAQSDKFIDYVVDQTELKNNARIVKFTNETLQIDKIGVGRRVAVPAAEAADPGVRRGVQTSKVTLQPKEIMVPFEVGDSFKEINIEGEDIEDTVIRLMATQVANDLEELYVSGDTVGPAVTQDAIIEGGSATQYVKDNYLALANGWLRLADSANVYDAAGANIGLSVLSGMLRALPTKFRRDKRNLRWFMSPDLWQLYTERLASRATAMGDAASEGKANTPFGVQAVEVPLMPFLPKVVQHVTLNGTTPVALRFGPVQNVIVTADSLDSTPTDPYVEGTDYSVNETAGTITRIGGAISDGATVKVTYDANPQILLTHRMNFIVGIGRDIRIEKDRDIYKRVTQFAITVKVSVEFEEASAVVKGVNIGQAL